MSLRHRLRLAVILLVGIMAVAVSGYMALGHASLLDSIYMAVITIASVGYGEVVPTQGNTALRVFNIFVVVVGVAIMVYVFSVFTAFLVEGEIRDLFWRRKMQKRIDELKDHYVVCGLGDTGRYAVDELHRTGTPYVVVESHEDNIKKFREHAGADFDEMLYVIGDATDEAVLDQAGLARARGLISALAGDKDNLVTTVMARQKSAKVRIVTRCTDPRFSERMMKAGANATVSPNRIGGMRMASEVLRPHVVSFLDIMLKDHARTLRIEEIEVPENSGWTGATLRDLDLRGRFKLLVLATKGNKSADHTAGAGQFHPNPPDGEVVQASSVIIAMGDVADIHKARHEAHHVAKHATAVKN